MIDQDKTKTDILEDALDAIVVPKRKDGPKTLLEALLRCHTTKQNIIWATDSYVKLDGLLGHGEAEHEFRFEDQIRRESVTGRTALAAMDREEETRVMETEARPAESEEAGARQAEAEQTTARQAEAEKPTAASTAAEAADIRSGKTTTEADDAFGDMIEDNNLVRGRIIRPRCVKARAEQLRRVKDKAEVFTPSWVCNRQNNLVDEAWFGREPGLKSLIEARRARAIEQLKQERPELAARLETEQNGLFNLELKAGAEKTAPRWVAIREPLPFNDRLTWQAYVLDRRMEITCGEAPYLASRYDTVTGDEIADVVERIGLLDRKLRVVTENFRSETGLYDYMGDKEEWYINDKGECVNRDEERRKAEAKKAKARQSEAGNAVEPTVTNPDECADTDNSETVPQRAWAEQDLWFYWAERALTATYGYEWQGDSLLLAREALLATVMDHFKAAFPAEEGDNEFLPAAIRADLDRWRDRIAWAAYIIAWNVWQMDGLKMVVPGSCERNAARETQARKERAAKERNSSEQNLFGYDADAGEPKAMQQCTPAVCPACQKGLMTGHIGDRCRITDWQAGPDGQIKKGRNAGTYFENLINKGLKPEPRSKAAGKAKPRKSQDGGAKEQSLFE